MLSRVTGLIRETLIARAFGASEFTDAFNVAFRIPNLLRRLFAEGAFSQAFVPILGEFKNRHGQAATRDLVDAVATILVWALVLVTLLGMVATPAVVYAIATGFKSQGSSAYTSAVFMTRVMFPYITLISLVALASGILNTWRNFSIPAFTPTLLNLCFIISAIWVAPHLDTPIYAMAYGVLAGGVAQLAIQIPALLKIGMLPRISLNLRRTWQHPGVRRVLRQMLPATFALSIAQLSVIINTNIASRLPAGSVSWLSYADRLMEFPTALLGVALGTILLPSLSKAHAEQNQTEYSALLDWGLRLTFLLAAPSALGLLFFGTPLTACLFHYGQFNATDVEMTRQALASYGLGLMGLILIKILAPGFYARQDIRTPVKIGILVLVLTQLANLAFVPWLGHAGLALSVGVGACINATALFTGLRWKRIYQPSPGWARFFAQLIAALLPLAGLLWWLAHACDWIALAAHPALRLLLLLGSLTLSAVVYFGTLWCMGFKFSYFRRKSL